MGGLYKEAAKGVANGIDQDGRWLIFESAIVAENEDPEKLHRIKVVIPSIDEDLVYDDWVRPAGVCLGNQLGTVIIPPKGSEVLVTGVLGQKFNLVYTGAIYNEEMSIPAELGIDTPGIKVPKNLSLIAGLIGLLQAQNIRIIAEALARMSGQNTEVIATALAKMSGQNTEVVAQQLAKMLGATATVQASGTALLKGGQVNIQGGTITLSNGNISIQGGSVSINGSSVTIRGRPVSPVGPPI